MKVGTVLLAGPEADSESAQDADAELEIEGYTNHDFPVTKHDR